MESVAAAEHLVIPTPVWDSDPAFPAEVAVARLVFPRGPPRPAAPVLAVKVMRAVQGLLEMRQAAVVAQMPQAALDQAQPVGMEAQAFPTHLQVRRLHEAAAVAAALKLREGLVVPVAAEMAARIV